MGTWPDGNVARRHPTGRAVELCRSRKGQSIFIDHQLLVVVHITILEFIMPVPVVHYRRILVKQKIVIDHWQSARPSIRS